MARQLRVILLVLLAVPAMCRAQSSETEQLRKEIDAQNSRLQDLQDRLDRYESAQQNNNQIWARQISELASQKAPEAKVPGWLKWAEKIKLSGDFRYRHETIEAENDGKPDRHRNRIRARLGLNAKVNDEWDVGVRIATGGDDPVSTNQTLGSSFSSKGLRLDKAYLDYHPDAVKNLHILAGKMGNPFHKVGKNQLIWDGDLTPEGIAAKHKFSVGENDEVLVNGGGFFVTESSSSDADMSLWGIQAAWKHQFDKKNHLLGGISYYDFGNIKYAGDLDVDGTSFFGNTSSDGTFVNDYDMVELFAEIGTKSTPIPLALYGNYVENTAADTKGDSGWLVGCKINKAKNPGSWEFSYDYRELQKDAVVGAFSDSDFIGGGTNGRGSRFGAKYQLTKNVQAGLTYFLNERKDGDHNYRRLQVDMVLKF